ncbi:MAG: metal-dependent hydrolase [Deinococcales bacterium]
MKLHYLGHSGFCLYTSQGQVLIDPFLTGNPVAVDKPEAFDAEYIVLSHGHGDHYGDSEGLAKKHDALLIGSFEVVNYAAKQGVKGHGMNPGGAWQFPFGKVKFTPAFHSSSLPDGSYGGQPMGIVLELAHKRLYHAGDTALFSDMSLIARKTIDVAMLPIGDNFTMGPEDALEAVKLLKAKKVIPIHYNTFGLIAQDVNAFKAQVEAETDSQCIILAPGASIQL